MRIAFALVIGLTALQAAPPLRAQNKLRVFVTVNATRRSQGYKGPVYKGTTSSIEDRTVEISRDFANFCKEVTVSSERKKADYVARFSWVPERTEVAVYKADGDLVGGTEKRTVANAVKGACEIMKKDQPQGAENSEEKSAPSDSAK